MYKCLNVFTELFHYNLSRYLWTVVTSAPRRNLGTTNLWLRDAPGRAPAAGSRDRHRPRAARLTLDRLAGLYVRTSYLGRWTRPGETWDPGSGAVSAPLSQVVGFTHSRQCPSQGLLPAQAGRSLPNLKPVWASGSNFGSPRVSSGHKWGHGGAKLMRGLVPGQPGNSSQHGLSIGGFNKQIDN